ncbi:MAG: hypothetical protein GYA45_04845 [Pelolinea sp.]|nr:hypothetical protein [Pelolinea sp.]
MTTQLVQQIKQLLLDVNRFIEQASGLTLRSYQQGVAQAVLQSILQGAGRSFVVIFPRQSGKNELQAQLETYLLTLFSETNAELVKVSPTWKPQSFNAMRRLERVLTSNLLVRSVWAKEQGYIYRVGSARLYFFSGQPRSNIVGATASLLLEVDEAQDVLISKFDKEIAPMAASTNATRIFWGTAWTSRTLLARELHAARQTQLTDGIQRVFVVDADQVAAEVPAYGDFVKSQVTKLGRQHPMIKTQFFCEEIDAEGGLFPPERCTLMRGRHPAALAPKPGKLYAMTLDVAGEDEGVSIDPGQNSILENPARDATALTIAEVDTSTMADDLIRKPTYQVIYRAEWVGVKHTRLYAQLKALAELFDVRFLVVDSTGVGAGLSSFISAALPDRVLPFEFNSRTKSDLCWNFLALCDTGRFKDHATSTEEDLHQVAAAQTEFWRQVRFCEFEILPGPNKTVRWGVPDGTRDPATGELVHDDLLISAAMLSLLDEQDWTVSFPTLVIQAPDPLEDIDHGGF